MKCFLAKLACVACVMLSMWTAAIMAEHPELWAVAVILSVWFGRMAWIMYHLADRLDCTPERVHWKGERHES